MSAVGIETAAALNVNSYDDGAAVLLTFAESASLAGISFRALNKATFRGSLPALPSSGWATPRVSVGDLIEWREQVTGHSIDADEWLVRAAEIIANRVTPEMKKARRVASRRAAREARIAPQRQAKAAARALAQAEKMKAKAAEQAARAVAREEKVKANAAARELTKQEKAAARQLAREAKPPPRAKSSRIILPRSEARVPWAVRDDAWTPLADTDPVPLLDRSARQCAWPVGEPVAPHQQMCCGALKREGERDQYCETHTAMSRTKLRRHAENATPQLSLHRRSE